MTVHQPYRIFEIFHRYFNNSEDARVVVEELEQIVSSRFENDKKEFSSKSDISILQKDMDGMRKDMEILKKDMDTMRIELRGEIDKLRGEIERSSLRVESNLKSEINKLIVWIVATMLASGALFITLAKIFFDK